MTVGWTSTVPKQKAIWDPEHVILHKFSHKNICYHSVFIATIFITHSVYVTGRAHVCLMFNHVVCQELVTSGKANSGTFQPCAHDQRVYVNHKHMLCNSNWPACRYSCIRHKTLSILSSDGLIPILAIAQKVTAGARDYDLIR